MSWNMWHVHGHGFNCAEVSAESLTTFFKKHLDSLQDHHDLRLAEKFIAEPESFAELMESGCADFVAHIMKKETGYQFCAPGTAENGEDCVLFTPCYPWQMNEKERALTSNVPLLQILTEYSKELGLEEPDEYDLVYQE